MRHPRDRSSRPKNSAKWRDGRRRPDLSLHHRRNGLDAVHGANLRAQRTADAKRLVDLDLMAALERLLAPDNGRAAKIHARLTGIALCRDDLEWRALDLDRVEHAGTIGDQHGNAAIIDGITQRMMHGG